MINLKMQFCKSFVYIKMSNFVQIMRSLRINATNAHNIWVQNNVGIYERLIGNQNRRSGHHNFHVFLTAKSVRFIALSFEI